MKNRLIGIAKIILMVIIFLFANLDHLPHMIILHLGAGLRYGILRIFRPRQKISYKYIRYGFDDFRAIDHTYNNFANAFLGFLIMAIILILIIN